MNHAQNTSQPETLEVRKDKPFLEKKNKNLKFVMAG